MNDSPAVVLYDSAGTAMAVQDGVAIPANTPAVLAAGKDGAGAARVQLSDAAGNFYTRPHRPAHFSCMFRLTSRPYALLKAVTAASRSQFAVVQHPNTAVRTAYLRTCSFRMESASASGLYVVELCRIISAASTGNPVVNPVHHTVGTSTECTGLALPTSPGGELGAGGVYASVEYRVGATAAVPTTNPPPPLVETVLYRHEGEGQAPLALRPGVAEGWGIIVDSSATGNFSCFVRMEFWEE